jgi:poly(hydroxyalkanoate) depolymerase family esterase
MAMNFADAMRSATELTRGRKLAAATRAIQVALLDFASPEPSREPADSRRALQPPTIDLTANPPEPDTASAPQRVAEPRPATGTMDQVLSTLRQAKVSNFDIGALARGRPRKPVIVPDGAQFLSRSFSCAAGTRSYKLYVPRRRQAEKPALLIMLHGGTQDADDFAAGTRMNALAEEHGVLVAYPIQTKTANPSLCWNWFKPEDQRRGAGEPCILAGITGEIIAAHGVDPRRVFVAGLSAGGAMAAVMGTTYPEIYTAVGIHSGLAYRCASDVASAFAAMRGDHGQQRRGKRKPRFAAPEAPRMRTIVFHGDADQIVHPSNAGKIIETQRESGDRVERIEAHGSASGNYTRAVTRDRTGRIMLEEWLVHGSGHAWSGGSSDGSYTDPHGPDASRAMLRFFLEAAAASAEG